MRDEGTYEPPDSEHVAYVRARQIAECEFCDTEGMRGLHRCDHRDYQSPARRGMALIREALGKGKAK